MFTKTALVALLQASLAFGATVNVKVGGNQALTFTPASVQAAAGDTVNFQFLDQNHTVTSGTPGQGCKPSNQFNSGFVPIPAGTAGKATFKVQVQNTQPIAVYCAQAQHCQSGMVMVINPTASGATSLAAYQAVSAKAKTNTPAKAVNGGTLANVPAAKAAKGKAGKTGKAAGATGAAKAAKGAGAGKAAKGAKGALGGKAKKAKKVARRDFSA